MLERARSRISVENFLSGSIENLRSGTLLCLTNFLVSKKFFEKRRGGNAGGREGVSRFSVETFFVTSVEKIRRGIF